MKQHLEILLREEWEFFEALCAEWADEHGGDFVVIGKQTFGGFHKSYEAAMQAGVRAFGLTAPFLVARVRTHKKPTVLES